MAWAGQAAGWRWNYPQHLLTDDDEQLAEIVPLEPMPVEHTTVVPPAALTKAALVRGLRRLLREEYGPDPAGRW